MYKHIVKAIILFFLIVGIASITINTKNLTDYTLHHMLVEAIVERRAVKLGGSYAKFLHPNGDVITYQGNVYAIKQPGIGFLGALIYLPLSKLGLHYYLDYQLTSALVSIWATTVPVAITGIMIYLLLVIQNTDTKKSFWISLGSVLCTTLLPYSGFPHHDTTALLPLFFAIYCVAKGIVLHANESRRDYFLYGGVFAGLTLFFSILPISLVIALGIVILWYRRFGRAIEYGFGVLAGLIPSFVYNYFVLGGILHFPNVMGGSADTIPHFGINQLSQLSRYLFQPGLSILLFTPLAILGLVGWIVVRDLTGYGKFMRAFVAIATSIFLLHLSSFETEGDLQYGARYFLPILPIWFMGLKFLYQKVALRVSIWILAVASFLVNLLGALYGAMNKNIIDFPFVTYFSYVTNRLEIGYPVRGIGIIMIVLGTFLLAVSSLLLRTRKHEKV